LLRVYFLSNKYHKRLTYQGYQLISLLLISSHTLEKLFNF
uniref:IS4 family transposase n=1 Tax=Strongyloides venezuelensis TaxID=75913 RepID=A0A0K0ETU9_STRVS